MKATTRPLSAGWPARERREPPLWYAPYLELIELSSILRKVVARELAPRQDHVLLDLGCARKPYYPYFAPYCAAYVGLDLNPDAGSPDCIGYMEDLPFQTAVFDVVLCTQAIAYVENPWIVLGEVHRVLKPGGLVVVSTHGVHPYMMDSWHFTARGLRRLFEQKRFEKIRVVPNGGAANCFFQLVALYLNVPLHATRVAPVRGLISAAIAATNITGLAIDKMLLGRGHQFCCANYVVLARTSAA